MGVRLFIYSIKYILSGTGLSSEVMVDLIFTGKMSHGVPKFADVKTAHRVPQKISSSKTKKE